MIHEDSNPSAAAPVRARTETPPPPPEIPNAANRDSDAAAEARHFPGQGADSASAAPPTNPPEYVPVRDRSIPEFRLEQPALRYNRAMPTDFRKFPGGVPEDLRVPWDWKDLILFVIFGFAGLLVFYAIATTIAVMVFHLPMAEITGTGPSAARPLIAVLTQAAWSVYVLLYFYALVRTRSASGFWHVIGWRGFRQTEESTLAPVLLYLGLGAIAAVIASVLGRFVGQEENLPIEQMFHSRIAIILLMAFGILVAPLIEETMFRGFLYPVLARRLGVSAGIVLTGILFGAMHMQQLWGGWGQVGLLMLVGMFLTWIRARSGTVAASYLVHLGYNGLLFLGFFAATSGLHNLPGAR